MGEPGQGAKRRRGSGGGAPLSRAEGEKGKMRIALVVLSMDIGGQERLILRIIHGLEARGHEVHLVTLSTGGALRDQLGSTPVHEVPFRGAKRAAGGFDRTLHVRLIRLFRRIRPDVVHTHNGPPLIYAAPVARLLGARVVHTKHGKGEISRRMLPLCRMISRTVHRFVAVSADTAEAARRGEAPPRLSVIENGIPLAAFRPDAELRYAARAELGIASDAVVVGSVGRLVEEKDYPLLVRALGPRLSDKVRLVLVGDGPARPAIEAAVAAAGVGAFVTLTGARHDVPRLLAGFDVFAMSSRTEGVPLALPEAMTSQLPVVATAVGGVPGIVPEDTGFLVAHGDAAALGDAIGRLVNDPALRAQMGERARAYALGRFSEENMLNAYLALYEGEKP